MRKSLLSSAMPVLNLVQFSEQWKDWHSKRLPWEETVSLWVDLRGYHWRLRLPKYYGGSKVYQRGVRHLMLKSEVMKLPAPNSLSPEEITKDLRRSRFIDKAGSDSLTALWFPDSYWAPIDLPSVREGCRFIFGDKLSTESSVLRVSERCGLSPAGAARLVMSYRVYIKQMCKRDNPL